MQPDTSRKGCAVPLAAIIFSATSGDAIPAGYVGLWSDGTALFMRGRDGSDTPQGVGVSALLGADETIAAAGAHAVAINKRTTHFDLATAGNNIAASLADGTFFGQRKTVFLDSVSAGKSVVLTPAHAARFTTATLAAAGDGAELEWQTAGWKVVGISGAVVIA